MIHYVLLALVALLPAIFFIVYITAFDSHKPEPQKAIVISALLGGVAAAAFVWFGAPYNWGIMQPEASCDWKECLEMSFLRVTIPAEIVKWTVLCIFFTLNKYYDEYVDGIVYSVCLSMGYAGIWGACLLFNFIGDPFGSFIERCIITALVLIPLHFLTGTVMGYFLALARGSHKIRNHALALFFPILIGGIIFFTAIMMSNLWWACFLLGIVLAFLATIVYSQIFRLLDMDGVK